MFGDVLLAGDTRVLSHDGDDLAHFFLYWQDFTFTEMRWLDVGNRGKRATGGRDAGQRDP
jgi:hypothetical protein